MGNFNEVYAVMRETEKYLPKDLYDRIFDNVEKLEQKVLEDSIDIADMAYEDGDHYGYNSGCKDTIEQLKEQGELDGGS